MNRNRQVKKTVKVSKVVHGTGILAREVRSLILLSVLMMTVAPLAFAAREGLHTIANFSRSGGTYSLEIWSRSTGTTAIRVGITSYYLDYNNSGLASPTLSNINPKYTGTAGVDDYDPMTVQLVQLGGVNKIAVTIWYTGNDTGVGRLLSSAPADGERICTVNMTITDPSTNSGLSWDETNSAMTNSTGAPVSSSYVGSDNGPLPITLASFTGTVVNAGHVFLDWTTISEVNNYGFFVQRRRDTTSTFTDLPNGFVPGHGTTLEPQHYAFTDSTISSIGTYHYRLRQVDLDGTMHYTQPVSVNITVLAVRETAPIEFRVHQNYPNPFNPTTTIKFSVEKQERTTVSIFNVLGQEDASLEVASGTTLVSRRMPPFWAISPDPDALGAGVFCVEAHELECGES
jgi:hypothetical protein